MGMKEAKPTEGEASGAGADNLGGLHSNFLYLPPRDSDLAILPQARLMSHFW